VFNDHLPLPLSLSLSPGSEFLSTQANPLIYQPFWAATQMVKSPDPKFETVYDQWLNIHSKDYNGTTKPTYVHYLISASKGRFDMICILDTQTDLTFYLKG
jgi:hypothetical protein